MIPGLIEFTRLALAPCDGRRLDAQVVGTLGHCVRGPRVGDGRGGGSAGPTAGRWASAPRPGPAQGRSGGIMYPAMLEIMKA